MEQRSRTAIGPPRCATPSSGRLNPADARPFSPARESQRRLESGLPPAVDEDFEVALGIGDQRLEAAIDRGPQPNAVGDPRFTVYLTRPPDPQHPTPSPC